MADTEIGTVEIIVIKVGHPKEAKCLMNDCSSFGGFLVGGVDNSCGKHLAQFVSSYAWSGRTILPGVRDSAIPFRTCDNKPMQIRCRICRQLTPANMNTVCADCQRTLIQERN